MYFKLYFKFEIKKDKKSKLSIKKRKKNTIIKKKKI